MSLPKWAIHRRAFLRGLGATISLPFLEAMMPYKKLYAQSLNLPPRMIYLWFDLGVYRTDWVPTGNGQNWALPPTLSSLMPHKNDIIMLRRVRNYYGDSHNEGGGDHARSIGTFLTCAHARYGDGHPGPDFGLPNPTTARLQHQGAQNTEGFAAYQAQAYANKISGSVDQLAARLPWNDSYQLKSVQMRVGGGGDSHHNAINQHLSWLNYNTPAPRFENVQSLFDTIYQRRPVNDVVDPRILATDRSILDTVGPTVTKINKLVGAADKMRLEKYLAETRVLEKKISSGAPAANQKVCGLSTGNRPPTSNLRFDDHIKLTLQLYVKAFQCDITRVATHGWHYGTFSFLQDAAGRTLNLEPHNSYSHHGDAPQARDGLRRISQYWAEIFAGFLQEMKQADDNATGSLLDNSQILFGCGMQDGNGHNSDYGETDLPIVLAGKASGKWSPGRLIDTGSAIRLADIHLDMLRNMGSTATQFGDSVGLQLNL